LASPDRSSIEVLWNRWLQVWHEGRYEFIPACVAPVYIRHYSSEIQHHTPASYEQRIRAARDRILPGIRIHVHDLVIADDRLWVRGTNAWTDPETGNPIAQAFFQEYRVEDGKLAETWFLTGPDASTWPDYQPGPE
jgi:hypothetical protein